MLNYLQLELQYYILNEFLSCIPLINKYIVQQKDYVSSNYYLSIIIIKHFLLVIVVIIEKILITEILIYITIIQKLNKNILIKFYDHAGMLHFHHFDYCPKSPKYHRKTQLNYNDEEGLQENKKKLQIKEEN
jgi:hypothetical protein